MSNIICFFSIKELSHLSGLDEKFLQQNIDARKLRVVKIGDNVQKISDIEFNRFAMDLQYQKSSVDKLKANNIFKNNNNGQKDFFDNLKKNNKNIHRK